MSVQEHLDYGKTYDAYWQRADRVGESSGDLTTVAERVATTCGFGMTLDVGSGEGRLVGELLQKGIDAYGLDVSEVVVARSNERWPGRFRQGSVLALPYGDGAFQTVVSTDCMEHLAPGDVPKALLEMYRVSSRFVFLQIATTQDRDNHWHLTVEGRTWWETRCFEAGFRKHPSYYRVNPYESLNTDDWQICVLLEKIPQGAIGRYPMSVLDKGRILHMDMLRETGRRGDAHCIRYHVAAQYIRPGDVVLDVACGLGYGSHILYQNSQAKSVLGVDCSDFGIAYAEANYSVPDAVQFRSGDAQDLSFVPDNSVDFITGFETIEHVPNPDKYLAALQRVLRPSGRLMICAPNDWTDETGRDPNPHHLHVYTWKRLIQECRELFLLEKGFAQVAGGAMKCQHSPRTWVEVGLHDIPERESEWAVLLCMKDPVGGKGIPYTETTWRIPDSPEFNVAAFGRDYDNPWLVKGMVAIGMRTQSADNLRMMQEQVLGVALPDSVDFGAALCGQIYGKLAEGHISDTEYACSLARVRGYAAIENPSPHQLRWQVSLLFAGAELARRRGNFNDAVALYTACAERDVLPYSPLLGNKTLDALHWLAMMAIGRQDQAAARKALLRGIEEAKRLVSGPWINVRGDPEYPLPFGLPEIAQLLDKASRATYMLASLESSMHRPGVFAGEAEGYYERMLVWKDNVMQELTNELRKRDSQILSVTRAMAERDAQMQSVLDSHSWRLTSPLREIAQMVRGQQEFTAGLYQSIKVVYRHLPQPLRYQLSVLRHKIRARVRRIHSSVVSTDGPSSPVDLSFNPCDLLTQVKGTSKDSFPRLRKESEFENGFIIGRTAGSSSQLLERASSPHRSHVVMLVAGFNAGGLERVVLDLARGLRDRGHQVTILSAGSVGQMAEEARKLGLDVLAVNEDVHELEHFTQTASIDLVFTHHCYYGLEVLSRLGVPVVEVLHNAYYWQRDDLRLRQLREATILTYIAVSSFVREFAVSQLGVPADRVEVINNGLSCSGFIRPGPRFIRKFRRQELNRFTFVHTANFHGTKCHHTVVTAFSRVARENPLAHLLMVGEPLIPELATSVAKRVDSLGLLNRISLPGSLNRHELSYSMSTSHAALLPSSVEGFSIASLEYLHFGLPVIITDTGAARDVFYDKDVGLVIPGPIADLRKLSSASVEQAAWTEDAGHATALAEAMLQFIADREQWLDKIEIMEARSAEFRVERVIAQYERFLLRVTR